MVALPQRYNTADLPDTGGVVLIPDGQYPAVIVKSEMVTTKNGQGQFLALTIVITQGQYQNTEFIERLNIVNNNQKAVEIAYKTLARISEALGWAQTPADSNEMHNIPFMIDVATEAGQPYVDNDGKQQQGKDKSYVKKYLAMPAAGAQPPAQQQTAQPAQQQQQNAFAPPQQEAQPQQQAAVSNPFAPPAS